MQHVLLSMPTLMNLIFVLTVGVMITGLQRTPGQAPYKPWLLTYLWASLASRAISMIVEFSDPELSWSFHSYLNLLFTACGLLGSCAFSQLAYLFPGRAFQNERKWVLRVIIGLGIPLLGIITWNNFFSGLPVRSFTELATSLGAALGTLIAIWSLLIFFRKARYFRQHNPDMVTPNLLMVGVELASIGIAALFIYPGESHPLVYPIFFASAWLLLQFLFLIIIIYSEFPIRFQDKLVGFAFASVMTILSYTTLLLVPVTTTLIARIPYQHELRVLAVIILGSAVFVLWLFPFILRVSIIRPLQQLLTGIQRVDKGDLLVQVPVGMLDEIGTLTQNFNQMTQSIKESKDELTQYAETLEVKVAERTAALNQSLSELRTTQTQLIQKEKMASLGELTAGIAHEIQNPLNFVNNFAEVSTELIDELREEETKANRDAELVGELLDNLAQNLQKIGHHGGRASAIVRGMLEHSRTATGERQSTDLNALVEEYLRLAYQGWRARDREFTCELVTDFDISLPQVEVVPQEIGRLLLNLYNNAFYAMQQRQKQANNDESYVPTVWVSSHQRVNGVEIRVKDNGVGIRDAEKDKIFQPFFTTKPTGQGTGLGLSLSYDIVTKGHGGSLTVESQAGEGTEFVIQLPA